MSRYQKPLLFSAIFIGYETFDKSNFEASTRSLRTGSTVLSIMMDYSITFRKIASLPLEEELTLKSACHGRSANKLLDLCLKNGGVYIKLGQHLSALSHLIPTEYTETLKVLQDQCVPSSIQSLNQLFIQDTGQPLDHFFSEFDPEPMGVASLAQVHRAILKETKEPVAVKIQHPIMDVYAKGDIDTCFVLVKWVKRLFPMFTLDWLAEEVKKNLPKEMDFSLEAQNAQKIAQQFKNTSYLKIPSVKWAQRRILCMEYIDGERIDNVSFMKQYSIEPSAVLNDVSRIFNQMIFKHGFLHCDPHPGNLFIVPKKKRFWFFGRNYQIVLLDHGLYRELDASFRLDYARFWAALISGKESVIEESAIRLFSHNARAGQVRDRDGIHYHRMFASMMTGRPWDILEKQDGLLKPRQMAEKNIIHNSLAKGGFYLAISDVLAALPTDLLLVLKTNDLLRLLETSLGHDEQKRAIPMFKLVYRTGLYSLQTLLSNESWLNPIFSTGDIADALVQLGFPSCFLPDVVGQTVKQRIAGPVYTIQYDTFDKTGISYPLDDSPAESIVIIHTPEQFPNAVWGGLMGTRAKVLKVAGVVTNGRFRDAEDLEHFPVYAKGKSCLGAKPFVKPVAANVPLTFEYSEHYSVTVNPGDWIVADMDGVVIVPAAFITTVIEKCSLLANVDVQCAQYLREGHSLKETFAKYR